MVNLQEQIKKLQEIKQQIQALQEAEKALRQEILEGLKMDKITVDDGNKKITVFKVQRIKVKDTKALPVKYVTTVSYTRADTRKIKAALQDPKTAKELQDLVAIEYDIQTKITENKDNA